MPDLLSWLTDPVPRWLTFAVGFLMVLVEKWHANRRNRRKEGDRG